VHTVNGRYYLLRILPYRTTRNMSDGIVITFVNISRQRRAEDLFSKCLEQSLIATIISDGNGEMQIINRQAERLFGWSWAELAGQPVEKLIPEELREWHRKKRAEYKKAPTLRTLGDREPATCLHKNGNQFKAEIGLAPLQTEEGLLVMINIRET